MPADFAEHLKEQLTDRWVTVDASVAELRRFARLTGQVKTVNMNGRALVEFQGTADRGWYDIDPAYLTLVDPPLPPPTKGAAPTGKSAASTKEAAPGQAAAASEVSPSSPVTAPSAPAAGVSSSGVSSTGVTSTGEPGSSVPRKLSPIELIRARKQSQAEETTPVPAPPSTEPVL